MSLTTYKLSQVVPFGTRVRSNFDAFPLAAVSHATVTVVNEYGLKTSARDEQESGVPATWIGRNECFGLIASGEPGVFCAPGDPLNTASCASGDVGWHPQSLIEVDTSLLSSTLTTRSVSEVRSAQRTLITSRCGAVTATRSTLVATMCGCCVAPSMRCAIRRFPLHD